MAAAAEDEGQGHLQGEKFPNHFFFEPQKFRKMRCALFLGFDIARYRNPS
jgi:hypothetical protein